jgi:hypothetical protein
MYPKTDSGRFVAIVAAIIGLVGLTLPITIIGVFFADLNSKMVSRAPDDGVAEGENLEKCDIELSSVVPTSPAEPSRVDNCKSELHDAIKAIAVRFPDLLVDADAIVVSPREKFSQ